MTEYTKRVKEGEEEQNQFDQRLGEVEEEREEAWRLESAVAAGLADAKRPSSGRSGSDGTGSTTTTTIRTEGVEEEAIATPVPTPSYPLELDAFAEFDASTALGLDDEDEEEESGSSSARDTEEEQQQPRVPLFEIGGDQIESSMKALQKNVALAELSVEELQRELELRKQQQQ